MNEAMMETADDCGEVDVSALFQQEASELIHVHNLESTLNKFGYSKGDRIERRELVLMYKKGTLSIYAIPFCNYLLLS